MYASQMPTPQVILRADGTHSYKVRFRHDGRATSRTFADNRAALRFAKNIDTLGVAEAQRILDESAAVSAESTWSVHDWCLHHIELLTGVGEDTLKDYRSYVKNDLGFLSDLPIHAVRRDDIARWVKWMETRISTRTGRPLSGKTISNRHGFFSAAFKRAAADKITTENPCAGTRLPKSIKHQMTFLSHDEYAQFLAKVVPSYQPFVATLFATGLRWGEITALKVGDIDTNRMTITVNRAWKRTGKLGTPKSKKSNRTIAIAPETMQEILPLTKHRRADAFLFTDQTGSHISRARFVRKIWEAAARQANLGKHLRIHDARHTNASWLLASGIPINYVQAHLGHESITTTVDRYGHIMPAAQQAIRGAMSNALAAAHPQIEAA